MKQAVILINPYLSTEHEFYQPRRIREELEKRGVKTDILPNFETEHVGREGIREELSARYSFCVYLDKDRYAPRMLEKRGMRLFNRAEAVELCDDKMLTHIALSGVVPMPRTFPAPLCYKNEAEALSVGRIGGELGYPVVVKECFGSFGKQVYLAEDRAALDALAGQLKLRPHLFQEYIKESAGRDVRAVCIGGEVVSCMLRSSDADFRSNLGRGGKGEPFEADQTLRSICKRASDALGLDYCGIDLLLGKEGYLLCEVNSNAFFEGIEHVTKKNVAACYAAYMCDKISL